MESMQEETINLNEESESVRVSDSFPSRILKEEGENERDKGSIEDNEYVKMSIVWVIVLFVLAVYFIFVFVICATFKYVGIAVFLSLFTTVCVFLLLVSYFRTVISDPGEIPADFVDRYAVYYEMATEEKEIPFEEIYEKKIAKVCQKCHRNRPFRAHHCKVCKKCVLKFDVTLSSIEYIS